MDPRYEQRLRDEVIYLHSLWHQGPPTPAAAARHLLQPSKPAQFKKPNKRKRKKGKRVAELAAASAATTSDSSPGAEWPSPIPLPPTEGWPNPEPISETKSRLPSADEQSILAAKNAHRNAVQVVNEFFRADDAGDSDGIESDSEDGDELMPEDGGREYYSFFFKVFEDNVELREHYEKNFVGGDFSCLVCGAVGGKGTSKKFMGCLPLVHHSITVAKTKKRRAHRALGQAICKVLGWDIDQLPAVVSLLSVKSDEIEGNVIADKVSLIDVAKNVDAVESKDGDVEGDGAKEALLESGLPGAVIVANGDEGNTNSVTCPDVDKGLDNSDAIDPGNVKDLVMLPVADKTIEHHDTVQLDNVEVPAAEELASGLVMLPDADKTMEHHNTIQPDSVEVPAVEELTSVGSPLLEMNARTGDKHPTNLPED